MTTHEYDQQAASNLVADFGAKPELLVQILHAFMERFGHISDAAIRQLATELNLSRADVHGVVSYYHDFRTEPAAANVVKICAAEACQAVGGRDLVAHAERSLGVTMHGSSESVTLEPVYCLGNCACSPAVMVNGKTYGRVSAARFDAIVAELEDSGA